MTDFGTFGDNLGRFSQETAISKPSRAAKCLPPSEAGEFARKVMGHTESTLDEIVASVAPRRSPFGHLCARGCRLHSDKPR